MLGSSDRRRLRAGERVAVGDAVGQRVGLPALAAVLGAEHLAAARRAVDLLGVARMGGDRHHGARRIEALVEARPGLAEIARAVEPAMLARRRDAEAGVEGARVVRRDANVAAVA